MSRFIDLFEKVTREAILNTESLLLSMDKHRLFPF